MSKGRILHEIQEEIENIQDSISSIQKDCILDSINFILESHTFNLITINAEPLDVLNISYLNELEKDIIKIKRLLKESYGI